MEQLVHAWDVLATMTPPEYSAMRPYLATPAASRAGSTAASSSRSATRTPAMLKPHAHRPDLLAQVEAALARALALRRGAAPAGAARPAGARRPTRARLDAALRSQRRRRAGLARGLPRPEAHWDLYQLGEELTDLEDAFRLWRFRHVTTVERVIGFKRGTGGTGGVSYLRKMLDVVLFPEIWKLRTDL